MNNQWKVIINPNAGKGAGLANWDNITKLLRDHHLEYDSFITEKPAHAIQKTTEFIHEGFRKFIAIGGDGTLNEVVNGIFLQESVPTSEITLAHIPVGNGNDWGRTFANPTFVEDSIQLIASGNTFLQDIGQLNYIDENKEKSHYFLNIAGFGFDAMVVKDVMAAKQKGKSGALIYVITLLRNLFRMRYIHGTIGIDNEKINTWLFSIAVGMCKYNGGGMMILPFAKPDTGSFDITIIRDIRKMDVILNVLNLFNGSFIKHRKVSLYNAKEVEIQTIKPMMIETDGEVLGYTPARLKILPSALKVVVNSTNFEVQPKLLKYVS